MKPRRVTFVASYYDSEDSESDHDSIIEDDSDTDSEDELDLDPEIILGDLESDSEEDDENDPFNLIALHDILLEPAPDSQAQIPSMPTSSQPLKSRGEHDDGTRIQCLTLIGEKVHYSRIKAITGMSQSAQSKLRTKALERGWDPTKPALLEHVASTPRSGRPSLSQEICDEVLKVVTKNSSTRQWSCQRIAEEVSQNLTKRKHETEGKEGQPEPEPEDWISASSVYQVLKKNGYRSFKHTVKPGLTKIMKETRL